MSQLVFNAHFAWWCVEWCIVLLDRIMALFYIGPNVAGWAFLEGCHFACHDVRVTTYSLHSMLSWLLLTRLAGIGCVSEKYKIIKHLTIFCHNAHLADIFRQLGDKFEWMLLTFPLSYGTTFWLLTWSIVGWTCLNFGLALLLVNLYTFLVTHNGTPHRAWLASQVRYYSSQY